MGEEIEKLEELENTIVFHSNDIFDNIDAAIHSTSII